MTLSTSRSEWPSPPYTYALHASRSLFADSAQLQKYSALQRPHSQTLAAALNNFSPRSQTRLARIFPATVLLILLV